MSEYTIEPIEPYGFGQKNRVSSLFSKIGVVGCGAVGRSIALTVSQSGMDVIFIEPTDDRINHSFTQLETNLNKQINHWGMTTGEKKIILSRIKGTSKYEDFVGCDLVIECLKSESVAELYALRRQVFKSIEAQVDERCIIATNSTAAVITELSTSLKIKNRCIGLHFLTTNPNARVVEIVKGLHTAEDVYEDAFKFIKMIGKTPIHVEESPGLISIRIIASFINEACEVLMEGVSSKENIDLTMKNYLGLVSGPFEFADRIGIDKLHTWMEILYSEFGDMKYKANPIIKKLVRANHLGKKTGQGFYTYDAAGKRASKQAELYITDYGF